MELDPKALGRIARACRKHGITSLKTAQLEIVLSGEPVKERSPAKSALIEVKLPQEYQALTDDELLFGGAE